MSTEIELSFKVRSEDGRAFDATLPAHAPIWFGRDAKCQLVLADVTVSRRHGWISRAGTGVVVGDASSNGILVNGAPLHRAERVLAEPGWLQVGPFRVDICRVGSPQAAPPTALPPSPTQDLPPATLNVGLRRAIHRRLLEHLDLSHLDRGAMDAELMRPRVMAALRRILAELPPSVVPQGDPRSALIEELCDEAVGLGPLEPLLADDSVSEVMVVDPETLFFERNGRLERSPVRFTDDDAIRAVIERIVTPLGRRIDESSPLVDARLPDGSRVNAIIPPLALRGPCITIRKFPKKRLRLSDLIRFDTLTEAMGRFLERAVRVRKNIVISGGTGSGKTTLLNVLSAAIPEAERVVTIEDAAELQLAQTHVVSLESRPPNMEGRGAFTIRDLVRNALRMRPDRIVVGECRGGEAIDMLQAMNTGHEGSMTTTHANSPREAVARLETLCLMAGLDLPVRAIRWQIAASVHVLVQQTRFSDGSRRITSIAEVGEVDEHDEIAIHEVFRFERTGTSDQGQVLGEFYPTGYVPSFIDQFINHGLVREGDYL